MKTVKFVIYAEKIAKPVPLNPTPTLPIQPSGTLSINHKFM